MLLQLYTRQISDKFKTTLSVQAVVFSLCQLESNFVPGFVFKRNFRVVKCQITDFFCFFSPDSVRTRNDMYYLLPERSCVPDSPVWFSGAQELPQHQIDKMLQVNLITNPTIFKKFEFSRQKKVVHFSPNPSLKIRTASTIFWNYLGIFRDYGLIYILFQTDAESFSFLS